MSSGAGRRSAPEFVEIARRAKGGFERDFDRAHDEHDFFCPKA